MSPHLGVYGDAVARTPTLDRLATQSVRFTRAFTTAPVCAPSRAAIITGMYQTAIGAQHMRTTEDTVPELPGPYLAVPPFYVKAFPEYLRAAGYYTSNRAKTDYQFGTPFTIWDDLGNQAHWRNRADKSQPFFSVFNLEITHESRIFPSSPARKGKPLVTDAGEDQGAALLPGQPRRPRRARADVRQHRRHGRPGRGDPPPAGGRRPGRQHHRVLLERSRRRRAARQALALRLRPARPADDSPSAASRCPRGAGYGQRRAGQLHRSRADGSCPRRRRRSRAHAGPRAGRAGEGTGAGLRLRGPRSDGCRIRHDAVGPRRALPLHPQLLSRSCPTSGTSSTATRARSCRSGSGCRPRASSPAPRRCGCAPRVRPKSSTTCSAIPIRSRTSPPSQPIAPRSNGCARRSPSG